MANKFYDDLISELTEELGSEGCRADWDEFHEEIAWIRRECDCISAVEDIDDVVSSIQSFVIGTRADLPSIAAFIAAEIEEAA